MNGRKLFGIFAAAILVAGVIGSGLIAYAVGAPEGATYMGTSKCRSCHMGQYKTWRKTKHAKVFKALQGDEKTTPDCLKCHTTGYGKAGGFVSEAKTPKLKGVGCESCHGPGSEHVKAAKASPSGNWEKNINRIPQNPCINCHNPHVNQKERVAKLRGN